MKKIAVITAGLNAAKFIEDCVESVRSSMTDGLFEVLHVYVDDGSTDNTSEVINRIAHPNLKYIQLDKNYGPSYARNFAVSQIECDYIFHLDADDVLFQNSLKYLFIKAEEAGSQWVYGDFIRANQDLKYIRALDYYGWPFKTVQQALQSMFTGWHFFQGNCLYSRELFDKVGGFNVDLRLGEDFELFTKFLVEGELPVHLPGPLYIHRNHESNATKSFTTGNYKEMHRDNTRLIFNLHSEGILNKLTEEDQKTIFDYLN